MTAFLRISDGTELLNVAHIEALKLGYRDAVTAGGPEHAIGHAGPDPSDRNARGRAD